MNLAFTYSQGFEVVCRTVDLVGHRCGRSVQLAWHEDNGCDGIGQLFLDIVQAASSGSTGSCQVRINLTTSTTTTIGWLVVTALDRLGGLLVVVLKEDKEMVILKTKTISDYIVSFWPTIS